MLFSRSLSPPRRTATIVSCAHRTRSGGYGYGGAPAVATGGGIGFGEVLVLGVLAVIAFQVISSLNSGGSDTFAGALRRPPLQSGRQHVTRRCTQSQQSATAWRGIAQRGAKSCAV